MIVCDCVVWNNTILTFVLKQPTSYGHLLCLFFTWISLVMSHSRASTTEPCVTEHLTQSCNHCSESISHPQGEYYMNTMHCSEVCVRVGERSLLCVNCWIGRMYEYKCAAYEIVSMLCACELCFHEYLIGDHVFIRVQGFLCSLHVISGWWAVIKRVMLQHRSMFRRQSLQLTRPPLLAVSPLE